MGLGDGANDTLMRIQRHMENFHRGHARAANCVEEFLEPMATGPYRYVCHSPSSKVSPSRIGGPTAQVVL